MSTITVGFTETAIVTLDVNGNGVASIGPRFNQVWSPTTCSIQSTGTIPANGAGNPATCTISVGFMPSGSTFVDSTYQVTGAASGIIDGQTVYYGQQIFATWANGNPGATATLTVNGTMTIPG